MPSLPLTTRSLTLTLLTLTLTLPTLISAHPSNSHHGSVGINRRAHKFGKPSHFNSIPGFEKDKVVKRDDEAEAVVEVPVPAWPESVDPSTINIGDIWAKRQEPSPEVVVDAAADTEAVDTVEVPAWPESVDPSAVDVGDIWAKRQEPTLTDGEGEAESGAYTDDVVEVPAWPESVDSSAVDIGDIWAKRSALPAPEPEQLPLPIDNSPKPPPGAKVYTTTITPNGFAGDNFNAANAQQGQGNGWGNSTAELEKREIERRAFEGMRATYYVIGLGACGQYDAEPAYVVALNSAQYGGGYPGPECFKSITITGGSRNGHAVATIKDECPTCPYGGLDMSFALFQNFASLDEGVATITWWYNDGSSDPAPQPTTSSTPLPPPPPTSTWQAPSTSQTPTSTSVYTPPPSTSTTPTSTYVPPTTSSTPSSSPPPSSSVISSSSLPSSSMITSTRASSSSISPSLALGQVSNRTAVATAAVNATVIATGSETDAVATAVVTGGGGAGSGSGNGSGSAGPTNEGNLARMSDVTLQLGNLVVISGQKALSA